MSNKLAHGSPSAASFLENMRMGVQLAGFADYLLSTSPKVDADSDVLSPKESKVVKQLDT